VYDSHASQREIYQETVEPMVQQTLRGFNTTVFAYGQTGTGKTFTMEGDVDDHERMGVIPRAVASIFRTLEARGEANESFVKASYLEIYNENCTDLLAAAAGSAANGSSESSAGGGESNVLRVVEDKTRGVGRGVIVHGLQEVLVRNVTDIQRVMKQAISKRKTAGESRLFLFACKQLTLITHSHRPQRPVQPIARRVYRHGAHARNQRGRGGDAQDWQD
jgi:hypothetical protein